MSKFILSATLLTLALFSNVLIPNVATVTFQPNTTLNQVVDLLNQHNTWPEGQSFTIGNGMGFFFFKDSMSVAEREHEVWLGRQGMDEINGKSLDPTVIACAQAPIGHGCPVLIEKIVLLNPPASLLDMSIVASSKERRQLHPFFRKALNLGPPPAP